MKTTLRLLLFACLLQPLASIAQYCHTLFPLTDIGVHISSFELDSPDGGILQLSGDDEYTNYVNGGPGTIARLAPGGTYSGAIVSGSNTEFPVYYTIWIDLDQSGSFSLNERLAIDTTYAAFETTSPTVVIPSDAKTGYTRLRVLCTSSGDADPTDACYAYAAGETEDYTVVIDNGTPCIPLYGYGTTADDLIDGFVLGTINNTGSGGTAGAPYSDYTHSGHDFITSVAPGGSYTATITSGADGSGDHYTIWADLNSDHTFAPNEVLGQGTTGGNGVQTTLVDVTIPADAQSGYATLRVICTHGVAPTDACGTYLYGETEDYTLVIQSGPYCIPVFGYQGSDGDYVSGVQLADLNWSLPPGEPPPGYLSPEYGAHLNAGYNGTLTVTTGSDNGTGVVTAWLDLDGDGFMGDLIGEQDVDGPFGTATFPVNIPDDFFGYAALRVVCSNGSMDNDGCTGPGNSGTTTDFAIAVGHAGMPCLPLLGQGRRTGRGIVSVDLQGQNYTPTSDFPYYNFMAGYAHRFEAGSSEEFGLSTGTAGLSAVIIALDMNDDGDFSDTNEVLDIYSVLGPLFTILNIPANCPPGQHTLRLRGADPFAVPDPCAGTAFGNMIDIVVVVEDPNGPCIPFVTDWTTDGDFIDGVQLGGAQNLGTGAPWGPAYHAYLSPAIGVIAGVPDTLRITGGAYPGDSYSAWIDYNADNDFDDAEELLGWVGIADPYAVGELPFTVPNGTVPGNRRMRVRCSFGGVSDACATMGYGETEDYTVYIEMSTGVDAVATADFHLLPTGDGAQLVSDAAYIGNTYTLFDATGRVMSTGRITSDRTDLPMIAFAKGAYTVQLSNDTVRAAKRFVW